MKAPRVIAILLNRIRGKPNPLPPGVYEGVVKNAVVDALTGNVIIQYELTKENNIPDFGPNLE
jgi:hypothetical protein